MWGAAASRCSWKHPMLADSVQDVMLSASQPHLKPRQAMCAATSDAEHAVSTLAVGPRRPKA